ncbi:hypothetical protein O159_28280 [Leifsonia xyli subsp. cynodontis DSM 46306]|jgi:hypothetical protein|uniref:Uncharacterized protein n=1 Tax=Leifsonia xyli subsp. cynodontis DSM 46306 TaxID=1389489 RepID=U3PA20_LEIXC|nr:hypothetical protein [Leifsonia xyli]AGW42706.1 hypothetical protein O159_28280 [Leifsonia xyli subsp. cynodontis DSM 46306]
MKVRGLIQSSETSELTAEADDSESARSLVEEQLPEGYELLQIHSAMPRGGRVIATAVIRASAVTELTADGADYAAARDALHALIPTGQRLLSIVIVHE